MTNQDATGKVIKHFRSDTGDPEPSHCRKRRKKPQFHDALEELPVEAVALVPDASAGLPGKVAPGTAQSVSPRRSAPTNSATRTTAASPLRALPPVAASTAPPPSPYQLAHGRAAVRAELVILPSPDHASKKENRKAAVKKRTQRRTLTQKGKRAAVLKAVALVDAHLTTRAAEQEGVAQAMQPNPIPQPAPISAQQRLPTTATQAVHVVAPRPAAVPQSTAAPSAAAAAACATNACPAARIAAEAAPPLGLLAGGQAVTAALQAGRGQNAGAAAAAIPREWTYNLGKSWSKADITKLTRLATDSTYLHETIVDHPLAVELDWELIAKHLGRYSKGGGAVQSQYRQVLRTMKEARHEGRKGANYVDLVKEVLSTMPDRRGTVLQIQKLLKRDHYRCLDKYRDSSGALRWKKAVGEVLRSGRSLFEQVDKSAGGKIVWRLKEL